MRTLLSSDVHDIKRPTRRFEEFVYSSRSLVTLTSHLGDRLPRGYWHDKENVKKFLNELAFKRWRFRSLDDWYSKSAQDVAKASPSALHIYGDSLVKALTDLYPEHQFKLWRFSKTPQKFWQVRKNQRLFFDDLYTSRSFTSLENFYGITKSDIIDHGGRGLLEIFGNSVSSALMAAYPEHEWKLFRFEVVPRGYWSNDKNVQEYLLWLGDKLGLETMEDWYKVTRRNFVENGGSRLIALNKDSVSHLLKKFYPEHPWQDSKFHNIPLNFWNNEVNRLDFLRAMEEKFEIKSPEGWYRITMTEVHESGGRSVFPNRGALIKVSLLEYFHSL